MSRCHNVHGKFRFLLTGIYIVCLTLFTITAFADTYQHTISPTHAWQWQNKQANADGFSTSLQIEAWHIQEGDQGQQIRVRGQLPTDDSFPMISTLLAAPAGMRVEATLQPTGQSASTGISTGELDELPQLVEVGNAFQFRGIQLYPIRIHPIEIENGEYQVITNAQLNVHYIHDNDSPANDEPVRVTVESRRYLEAHVLNLDEIDLLEVAPVGRILVVTNDADLRWDQIKDYVTWKTQQGYKVDVAEPVNDSEWGVRSIIEEYYFNGDEIPLEYVLLIGDDNGAIRVSAYNDLSDHYYTEMEGNDYHADLAIGRFSVRSTSELRRVVNKTLAYERDVYMDDTEWLESACLTAGAGSGISPIQTKRSVKWMLNRNNISSDTLWFNMNGDITDFIIQSVNAGASYVNYRGLNGMDGWNSNDNGRFNNASRYQLWSH